MHHPVIIFWGVADWKVIGRKPLVEIFMGLSRHFPKIILFLSNKSDPFLPKTKTADPSEIALHCAIHLMETADPTEMAVQSETFQIKRAYQDGHGSRVSTLSGSQNWFLSD